MGLDSVELVIAWEVAFDISIPNDIAEKVLTPRQVTDYIFQEVKSDQPQDNGCLALRAFYRWRSAFTTEGIARREVRLDTKIAKLLPGRDRRTKLSALAEQAGFSPLRRLPFGLQFTSGRVTELVSDAVIGEHTRLRLPGHGWSHRQVREVVRAIIMAQLNVQRFSDDAGFIKDLGVD